MGARPGIMRRLIQMPVDDWVRYSKAWAGLDFSLLCLALIAARKRKKPPCKVEVVSHWK